MSGMASAREHSDAGFFRNWRGAGRVKEGVYKRIHDRLNEDCNKARPEKDKSRGHSSAGRAPALHAGGRRFDPAWLHQVLISSFFKNLDLF